MSNQELYNLIEEVEQGGKSADHAYERIKRSNNENRFFWITSMLVIAAITVFVASCYHAPIN